MDLKKTISCILVFATMAALGQKLSFDFHVIETAGKVHYISPLHVNNDGIPDLIMLTDNFTGANVYMGNAGGLYDPVDPVSKHETYRLLRTADLDLDGFDDLIFSSYWNNGFKIFWGSSTGIFSEGTHYSLTGHGRSLEVHDFNNDGLPDIAALSSGSGQPITLHIYYGQGSRNFLRHGVYPSVLDTDRQITIMDKNLDGLPDVMVSSSFPWFVIFYQQENGSFIPRYWPEEIQIPYPSNYLLVDLTNDQKVDIVEYYWEGEIRFYEGQSDTLFSEEYVSLSFLSGVGRFYAADMNQDGLVDLISNKYDELTDEPTDTLVVLLNKGNFNFEEPIYFKFPGKITYFNVADVDGDLISDVMTYVEDIGVVITLNRGKVLGSEKPPVKHDLIVFPNPFESRLEVKIDQFEAVEVYTLLGQHLYSSQSSTLETTDLVPGVYMLKVVTPKGIYWQKVIKH
ncbi:MAG: T9SS type A sorting domain-containing protein [Cyclobacteriaceae bacterium]|nr:T9SS type A sorting domain-containing protein [Cyclobacteriaceae bacterium SS2]